MAAMLRSGKGELARRGTLRAPRGTSGDAKMSLGARGHSGPRGTSEGHSGPGGTIEGHEISQRDN